MHKLTAFIPAAILGAGCILSSDRVRTDTALARPLQELPASIIGYTSRDVEINAAEQRVAGMSGYVYRQFEGDTNSFSVYVGYYGHQEQGRTIHSPKNCLPGSGWEAVGVGTVAVMVDGMRHIVNRYVLANEGERALVLYWYQGRGRVAANEYLVKWHLLRDAALHGRSEEALVRIVVPLPRDDGPRGEADSDLETMAERVAQVMIPAVDRLLPAWGS